MRPQPLHRDGRHCFRLGRTAEAEKTMNVLEWAFQAEPGERIEYHRGRGHGMIGTVGASALQAHQKGLVFLAQRRLGMEDYVYQATRISMRTAKHLKLIEGSHSYQVNA